MDAGSAGGPAGVPPLGTRQKLDPRWISLNRVVGWSLTAWVSLVAATIPIILSIRGFAPVGLVLVWSGWVVLSGGLGVWLYRWAFLRHHHASFILTEDAIEVRKGVISRHAILVPRSRVQHTDVSQGPLARRYGLGKLEVRTAGLGHSNVTLKGLPYETGLALRDHLLPPGTEDVV